MANAPALSPDEALIQTSSGWHGHLDILDAVLTTMSVPGFWSVFEKLLGDYAKRFGITR